MLNLDAINIADQVANGPYDEVCRLCYPLFKNTPIQFFTYQRYYDSGEILYLGTIPELALKLFTEDLFPSREELSLSSRFGLKVTIMSHLLPLPAALKETNAEKYEKGVAYEAEAGIYHGLFLVDRETDYYRICGFSVKSDIDQITGFYNNLFPMLENFINYFEFRGDLLIQNALGKSLIFLPYYHNTLLNYNGEKLTIDQLNIDMLQPSKIDITITLREKQCLELISKGYTMKNVAIKLKISHRTVEQHLRNIKEKYGLSTKNQLVEIWCDHYSKE